jgi:MFS family permease
VNRTREIAARIARSRNLRRLFGAFLLFNAVEYGTWVAFLVYAYEVAGPGSVGIIAVALLVPAAIVAPAASALGDRYPRRLVLAGGYLVYGAGLGATVLAMIAEAPVPLVFAVAAVGSAALAVVRPTQSAILPSLCQTPDELTSANGAAGMIEGLGILVGPLVAAVALSVGGTALVIGLSTVAIFAGGLMVLRLRVVADASGAGISTSPSLGVAANIVDGLRTVVRDPDATLVVGLMSARMLVIGAADVLFVLMALDLLGMGEPGAGILSAALGGGFIVGGAVTFVLVGRGRLATVAATGACLWGAALAISAWLAMPWPAAALIVAGGAGLAIVDVAGRTILQRSIRDDILAGVFGLQEGLAMVALAMGALLVPALSAVLGLTAAIIVVAAILPLVVVLFWSRLVGLDARTPAPVQAIALLRQVELFLPLPAPELEAIARRARWQSVDTGKDVIRAGEIGDRYFVLASGAVSVTRDGRTLRELHKVGAGFGEIALLRDVPRTATVTSTTESVFLTVDRQTFLAVVTGNPQVHARADVAISGATM